MPSAALCGPHQGDRRGELGAGAAPANLAVREIALVTIGKAKMLANLGDTVELILRQVFRQPVAAIIREIEIFGDRMPVEAHRVAHAARKHFRTAASRD
jgi:hypothetical protein